MTASNGEEEKNLFRSVCMIYVEAVRRNIALNSPSGVMSE